MRRIIRCPISTAILFLCLLGIGTAWSASPPEKGDMFPDLSLPVPADPAQKAYLGLSQDTSFKVPQIQAEVVIVEIFNTYCPTCQHR